MSRVLFGLSGVMGEDQSIQVFIDPFHTPEGADLVLNLLRRGIDVRILPVVGREIEGA